MFKKNNEVLKGSIQSQKYQLDHFLKNPLILLEQFKWMQDLNSSPKNEAFFSQITRAMDYCPWVKIVSLIFGDGKTIQVSVNTGASLINSEEITYKCTYLERSEKENTLKEIMLNNLHKKTSENKIVIYEKENKNENYFLFSSYERISLLPWFEHIKKSQSPLWIEPSEMMGHNKGFYATLVFPLRDQKDNFIGIVMAHIPILEFNLFLKKYLDEQNIKNATLFNREGKIIASSDHTVVFSKEDGQSPTLASFKETNAYDFKLIYERYIQNGYPSKIFLGATQNYPFNRIASFFSPPTSLGTNWTLMSLFYQESETHHMLYFVLSKFKILISLYVLSAISVFFLIRRMTLPLYAIETRMQSLRSLKIDTAPLGVHSRIRECQDMIKNLNALSYVMAWMVKFIPQSIAQYFIVEKKDITVFGEKANTSSLFCDMAGFTHLSEWMPPEDLLSYMSIYLNACTKVIMDHKGIVDQYIGDAISALWGAPYADPDHTALACNSALACLKHLNEQVNPQLLATGSPSFFISFGVTCGPTFVGTLGSSDHLQYTAIGNNVSRAQRLQELNRHYKTQILVDQNVYDEVHTLFAMRPVDLVFIQNETIMLYELLRDFRNTQDADLARISYLCVETEKAWHLYKERHWSEAKLHYENILAAFPADSLITAMISHCEAFLKTPPEASWDGKARY